MNDATRRPPDEEDRRMVALVQQAQQGNRQALAELVEISGRWVRSVVFSLVHDVNRTDDVVQTVWLRVAEQITKLRDPGLWRRWLYQIARNAAIDEGTARARRRRLEIPLNDEIAEGGAEPSLDEGLSRSEIQERVMTAIRSLPQIYREAFVLKHVQGRSYQQIAETLGVPTATVDIRLVRARRLLREALKDLAYE